MNTQIDEAATPGERVAALTNMTKLRLIRVASPEFSELGTCKGELYKTWIDFWDSLIPAERDPVTHPVWIVSWLNAFAAEQNDYFLAFLYDSNRLVGAALFHEEKRWTPFGWATDLVCPENAHSFGESVAIAQGYHATFFDQLFATTTPQGKRPGRVLFSRVDQANLLLSDPQVHRFTVERDPRSVLDTSHGLVGVAVNFSKNFRGNLRKARNKLKKQGSATFEVHTELDNCESAYHRFVEIEGSGWKSHRSSAIRDRTDRLEFYRQLLLGFSESEQALLTLMRIDDTDVAGQICVQFGQTLCIFKIGYREEYAKFAPGNMLLEYLIDHVCAQRGIQSINLVTSQQWHHNWRPESLSTYWVEVYSGGLKGWLNRIRFASPRRIAKSILQHTGHWKRPQYYQTAHDDT